MQATKRNTALLSFLLGLSLISCSPADKTPREPIIMAYYVPERDWQPASIPVEKLTHIIFSFTHVIDGAMKFRHPEISGPKLRDLVAQKHRNPNLKVMIACGGWGADGFSDMASSVEGRRKFISSAQAFIRKYKLDGLDIDWEYPAISGAGTRARPEDKENFTLLMQGLRASLDELDRSQTLTFASAGWKRYYDNIELASVLEVVDYMNIMTYDQVSGVSQYTGHHTPLGNVPRASLNGTPMAAFLDARYRADSTRGWTSDSDTRSVEKIVDYLVRKGVAPKQLVIGAAFYGRAWKGVSPELNGLYQLSKGIHFGWYAYHKIRSEIEPDSRYLRFWDSEAKAPFFYNATDSILLSYDDTVSVRMKMDYAVKQRLGGLMFWELGNDTKEPGGLLDAIYSSTQ
ncbi:MAG: glycoside hydrolase family 18 protein [Cyclobacteriaceae bacterium]